MLRKTHSCLLKELDVDPQVRAEQMGHTVDVNENVYTRTSLKRRREAVNALESALGVALTDQNGLTGNRGCLQVIEKDGAGDGTRTRDVQLGKLPFVCKLNTYTFKVLVLGYLTHWFLDTPGHRK